MSSDRRLRSVLRPVVGEVQQHLPEGDALVDVGEEVVVDRLEPGLHGGVLVVPPSAQLVDRRQRFRLGLGFEPVPLQAVAPALVGTEHVDEDRAEAALADDAVAPQTAGPTPIDASSTLRVAQRS